MPAGPRVFGRLGGVVRRVVGEADPARVRIDGELPRVAEAHRVDLGLGLLGADREQVARRDVVAAVGLGLDAQQLAAQVVRVGRRLAGVPHAVRALVERGVAARGLRVRVDVVADAEQQVAVEVEVQVAAGVAGLIGLAGGRHLDDQLRGGGVDVVVGADREARDAALEVGRVRVVGRVRRVVDVDPAVLGELRVQRDAHQAVLAARVDVERDRGLDDAGLRVVDADLAAHELGEEDAAVRRDVERERRARVLVERDLLEVRVDRAAAVAGLHAGGPLDAADDVRQQRGLLEVRAEVAHAGDPGTAAVVRLAPRDRMVVAHPVAARVVRALVHREQHVRVAADVGREVVPLVLARPAVAEMLGRRVRLVLVDDLALPAGAAARRGVAGHQRADEVVPPLVVAAHVGGVVDGDDAAAGLLVASRAPPSRRPSTGRPRSGTSPARRSAPGRCR